MVYTMEELKQKIIPIARKYDIPVMYVFGSYARGEATDKSDVDVLFKREGSKIQGLLIGALYEDLYESLGKNLDLITEESLKDRTEMERSPWFIRNINKDKVIVYERI